MTYKIWTSKEDETLKIMATSNNFSYTKIGLNLGRSESSCQSRATRLGIKNKHNRKSNQKYTVNENFWSEISPTTCYWAGFSAADASIQETTPGYYEYSLELKRGDEGHILKLKELSEFSGKLTQITKKDGSSPTSKIRIYSKKWAFDLKENFGITPKKVTTIMPPKISDNRLLLLWLIGYTDGDGCISIGSDKKTPYISYVSCNKELMKWVKNYFDNFGNQLKSKTSEIWDFENRYFKFRIGGLKAAQFINYVNNLGIYCLTRKWQNPQILKLVEDYKLKNPSLFPAKPV